MKKILIALLAISILTGCAAQPASVEGTSTTEETAMTNSVVTENTADNTAEDKSSGAEVDENGLITKAGIEKIRAIINAQDYSSCVGYTGLFDFNSDGIPEVYIVYNNGAQGLMPVSIFDIDGEKLGGFDGYCRDGFCRLSYGDNCVYIHNSYEHSAHLSYESVQKITSEDGKLKTEYIFEQQGAAENFPLLKMAYSIDGETVDEDEYFSEYNNYLWDDNGVRSREANEVSLCTYDVDVSSDDENAAEKTAEIYNSYISGNIAAKNDFGELPYIFSFDDYDADKCYEALVRCDDMSENWYYWDGESLTETEIKSMRCDDYTRKGTLLFAQWFGNSSPCTIIGVNDGKPYEHDLSCCGMFIRTELSLGFNRVDLENNIFILRKSDWDTVSGGGSHTFKPYYFESGKELIGIPATKDDFKDRPEVAALFDKVEADGGTVSGAYLRGQRYLNINYTIPIMDTDENGNPVKLGEQNYYRTYMIQNYITLIDEGRGIYAASITED